MARKFFNNRSLDFKLGCDYRGLLVRTNRTTRRIAIASRATRNPKPVASPVFVWCEADGYASEGIPSDGVGDEIGADDFVTLVVVFGVVIFSFRGAMIPVGS